MGNSWGDGPNAEAIEAWDTILFEKFTRFRWLLTSGLGGHGELALARLAAKPGERIVDLGCGLGDTTVAIGRAVGAEGEAVGVDCSKRFVEAATAEARSAEVKNVRFATKDVQTDELGGPYDAAFSRMGIMFFASPVAAMRNVRRALRPGGRLCAVVWRRREDNLWLYVAQQVVERIVPPPEHKDAPTCGPGPFSMNGPDLVSEQLQKAGFVNVTFERHDRDICIGRSLDEALAFSMALGPAGETLRLAGDGAEALRPRIVEELTRAYQGHVRDDGSLWMPASTWNIRAESPKEGAA